MERPGPDREDCKQGAVSSRATDLPGTELRDMDLRAADLRSRDLRRMDLQGLCLERADLRQTDLSGACLQRASLVGADLSGSCLARADLRFADLQRACLDGADLSGADLSGADLTGATSREARLQGARLAWTRGLDRAALQRWRERGARVTAPALSGYLGRLEGALLRRPALVLVVAALAAGVAATSAALWVEQHLAFPLVFPMVAGGGRVLFDIDCGSARDLPFGRRWGHQGGRAGREPVTAEKVRRASLAPPGAYLTFRQGPRFSYRFHVSPGWYQAELHFVQARPEPTGSRTFDILLEGQVAAFGLDLSLEAFPLTALVRRFAVRVDDGLLDLELVGQRGEARLHFLRVRRLDAARGHLRRRGE